MSNDCWLGQDFSVAIVVITSNEYVGRWSNLNYFAFDQLFLWRDVTMSFSSFPSTNSVVRGKAAPIKDSFAVYIQFKIHYSFWFREGKTLRRQSEIIVRLEGDRVNRSSWKRHRSFGGFIYGSRQKIKVIVRHPFRAVRHRRKLREAHGRSRYLVCRNVELLPADWHVPVPGNTLGNADVLNVGLYSSPRPTTLFIWGSFSGVAGPCRRWCLCSSLLVRSIQLNLPSASSSATTECLSGRPSIVSTTHLIIFKCSIDSWRLDNTTQAPWKYSLTSHNTTLYHTY
jgi:hypothetical protein